MPEHGTLLRRQLVCADPFWADFAIVPACTYLGFQIGPGATDDSQWSTPVLKHATRTTAISSQGAGLSMAATLYRQRAAPTL
eukprot:7472738-Pyramimonas_sp.AAC.1